MDHGSIKVLYRGRRAAAEGWLSEDVPIAQQRGWRLVEQWWAGTELVAIFYGDADSQPWTPPRRRRTARAGSHTATSDGSFGPYGSWLNAPVEPAKELGRVRRPRASRWLVVLAALIIVLVGTFAYLTRFPAGFDAPPTAADAISVAAALGVPPDAVHSIAAFENIGASYGSWIYSFDLQATDLASGASGGNWQLGTTPQGNPGGMAATASRVFVVYPRLSSAAGASPGEPWATDPTDWTINAFAVPGGAQSVVAGGTNRQLTNQDGTVDDEKLPRTVHPPAMSAEGDRFAYAEEAPTTAHPFAHRIVVRSLDDGHVIRSVLTAGMVDQLGMSGEVMAYRDCGTIGDRWPDVSLAFEGLCPLMVVSADGAAPVEIAPEVLAASVGAGQVAWIGADGTNLWQPGETTRGLMWYFNAGDLQVGLTRIAVGADVVAWSGLDVQASGDPGVCVWKVGSTDPRCFDAGIRLPVYVRISGGWLVWQLDSGDVSGVDLSLLPQ